MLIRHYRSTVLRLKTDMKAIIGHFRHFVVLAALALMVLGSLARSMPVHAGMTSDATSQSALHATASMPMDHAAMDGMSDADKTICELQCLALTVALPISPSLVVPLWMARMSEAQAVLLPAPYWSGPDGPPPKHMIL